MIYTSVEFVEKIFYCFILRHYFYFKRASSPFQQDDIVQRQQYIVKTKTWEVYTGEKKRTSICKKRETNNQEVWNLSKRRQSYAENDRKRVGTVRGDKDIEIDTRDSCNLEQSTLKSRQVDQKSIICRTSSVHKAYRGKDR